MFAFRWFSVTGKLLTTLHNSKAPLTGVNRENQKFTWLFTAVSSLGMLSITRQYRWTNKVLSCFLHYLSFPCLPDVCHVFSTQNWQIVNLLLLILSLTQGPLFGYKRMKNLVKKCLTLQVVFRGWVLSLGVCVILVLALWFPGGHTFVGWVLKSRSWKKDENPILFLLNCVLPASALSVAKLLGLMTVRFHTVSTHSAVLWQWLFRGKWSITS